MSAAINTQDIFGTPIVANVAQQALVRGYVSAISGNAPTTQYTVTIETDGNLGDVATTITVGQDQMIVHQPHSAAGLPQTQAQLLQATSDIFGRVNQAVVATNGLYGSGAAVIVRGVIGTVSGQGPTASVTFSTVNNGNPGDLANSVVIGPKQVRVQPVV